MKNKTLMKTLSAILAVVMVLCSAPLSGFVGLKIPELKLSEWNLFDFSVKSEAITSGIYTYTVSNEKATITDCSTSVNGSITIPSAFGSYPVTSIDGYAFEDCTNLTSVTIPDSITRIGYAAFYNCTSLVSVEIPSSIKNIGDYAFKDCTSLTAIIVDSNNKNYYSDSYGVLYNKNKTTLIQYPIGNSRKTFTIPGGVINIVDYAFKGCTNLTSVIIPDSVEIIGDYVFQYCSMLSSATIGDGVTSIGDYAFYCCESLESVIIGDNVKSIGVYAFYKCISIKYLTIPASVKISNGSYAFDGCVNIEKVTITQGTGSMFDCGTSNSSSAAKTYYMFTPWYISRSKLKEIVIKDGVENIGDYVFSGCSSITSVTIPDSVTSIGDYAFSDCSRLTSVIFGNSVKIIGDYVFSGCSSITSVTIPDSVTSIGDYAFFYCRSLVSVTFGNGVTSIGEGVFKACTSITSVTIPDSITNIGDHAFLNCTSLASVSIGDNVTIIGDYVFQDCTSLTSITMGDSVTSIGSAAFRNCTSLISITIGDSVTIIGNYAFYDCTSLILVAIGDNLTNVGHCAFGECIWIEDVYYSGTEAEWNKIVISDGNDCLTKANVIYGHEHTYTSFVTIEPTCEKTGVETFVCSCGESYTEAIPLISHTWGNWTVTKEPTETEEGLKARVCTMCMKIAENATIPAINGGIVVTITDTEGNVVRKEIINGEATEYTFEDVADGEYVVMISQSTYTSRGYVVTATDGKAEVEFKLNHTGDINGDGKVSLIDYTQLLRHVKKTSSLDGYAFDCADVNGDGKLSVLDYTKLLRHVKKTEMIW